VVCVVIRRGCMEFPPSRFLLGFFTVILGSRDTAGTGVEDGVATNFTP
jgi:hypothetical protein